MQGGRNPNRRFGWFANSLCDQQTSKGLGLSTQGGTSLKRESLSRPGGSCPLEHEEARWTKEEVEDSHSKSQGGTFQPDGKKKGQRHCREDLPRHKSKKKEMDGNYFNCSENHEKKKHLRTGGKNAECRQFRAGETEHEK